MKRSGYFSYMLILALSLFTLAGGAEAGWEWQNPLPYGNSFNGVWGDSGSNVFAVGEMGSIWRHDGSSWDKMTNPLDGSAYSLQHVWGSSANDVFVVGTDGAILHYNGSMWRRMESGVSTDLFSVWGASGQDVYERRHTTL